MSTASSAGQKKQKKVTDNLSANPNRAEIPVGAKVGGELQAARREVTEATDMAELLKTQVAQVEARWKGVVEELEGVRAELRESREASESDLTKLR